MPTGSNAGWKVRLPEMPLEKKFPEEILKKYKPIFSVVKIGGVRRDMDEEAIRIFLSQLVEIESELKKISITFLEDYSVLSRLKGIGLLSKQMAHDLGAVGPMMRASGVKSDTRKLGYSAYGKLDFEPITSDEGDSFARVDVRVKEIFQSIDLIRQALASLPGGEIVAPFKGNPSGEYFMRLEQPRGEALYYVKANGTKFLDRFRVRTPTFANIPALLEILKNCDLADVPILILTIDPCISCTER